jgi:hypothetical protein
MEKDEIVKGIVDDVTLRERRMRRDGHIFGSEMSTIMISSIADSESQKFRRSVIGLFAGFLISPLRPGVIRDVGVVPRHPPSKPYPLAFIERSVWDEVEFETRLIDDFIGGVAIFNPEASGHQ